MRKITIPGLTFILCTLFLTSCSKDNLSEEVSSYDQVVTERLEYNYNSIEVEILEEINLYRRALNLIELKPMVNLSIESEKHNQYMISQGVASHDNFSQRASYLIQEVGADKVGENIGYGYRTSQAVVNDWLKSKGHKENIEGNYTHFGISVRQDADGKNYFTNIFIKR